MLSSSGLCLGEGLALRGEQDDSRFFGGEFLDVFDAIEDGAGHHDHAGAAAVGFVVDFFVFVRREVADVCQDEIDDASLLRPFEDGVVQGRVKHLRKKCENIDSHKYQKK